MLVFQEYHPSPADQKKYFIFFFGGKDFSYSCSNLKAGLENRTHTHTHMNFVLLPTWCLQVGLRFLSLSFSVTLPETNRRGRLSLKIPMAGVGMNDLF